MSNSLGRHSTPEYALPQIPVFKDPLRTILSGANDSAPSDAPVLASPIDLTESRFGTGNSIELLIKGAVGTKITVHAKRGTDYYYINEFTTTKANQRAVFTDLPALYYVLVFTGVTADTTVIGGGTK